MDWLDLLAVQGILKSLLQHHNSKASFPQHSAFFIVQLSHPYMTTRKTIALTIWNCTGKDPDAGKDWGQEEKRMTEDEKVGWHHQLNGHKFEQALGVGDGQGGLACCSPWGRRELDTTEGLNWIDGKMQGKLPFIQKHLPPPMHTSTFSILPPNILTT